MDGDARSRVNAMEKCAAAARSLGYAVLALQDGGWCSSSSDAGNTYYKYGRSDDCRTDGRGGKLSNQVFQITEVYHNRPEDDTGKSIAINIDLNMSENRVRMYIYI